MLEREAADPEPLGARSAARHVSIGQPCRRSAAAARPGLAVPRHRGARPRPAPLSRARLRRGPPRRETRGESCPPPPRGQESCSADFAARAACYCPAASAAERGPTSAVRRRCGACGMCSAVTGVGWRDGNGSKMSAAAVAPVGGIRAAAGSEEGFQGRGARHVSFSQPGSVASSIKV